MRKISANFIFPVISPPIKYGILVIGKKNTITEVVESDGILKEQANLEFYNGILVPGFIADDMPLILSKTEWVKSNNKIFELIKLKLNKSSSFTFDELLAEYTLKRATSLKCDDKFGSFEAGKSPGIHLIYPFDFQKMTLNKESKIKQLV